MASSAEIKLTVEEISQKLIDFSIDREDLKIIISRLPEGEAINPVAVEYEIQLLKIISVGWSASFFLGEHPQKTELASIFWSGINEFSQNISTVTATTTGTEIDYFQTIKDRLDHYLGELNRQSGIEDPAAVIGPAFARMCKHDDNVHVIMAGARMFNLSVGGVKAYLESVEIV